MSYSSFAAVYDKLTFNVEYEKRAEYIAKLIKNGGVSGGILLDVACGTGTLSTYLSTYGYDMILADNSPEMLSFAREKLPDALILCQSMTELDLYGTIDCAVCSLDSVNHLTKPFDVKKAFACISLFTRPGGIFVFDVNTIFKHEHILANNSFVYEKDDVYCVWQNSYKKKSNTVDIDLDIFTAENGLYKRQSETFSERAYSLQDISKWLSEANFRVREMYDDMSFDSPCETSQRVYFVAEKI